MGNLTDLQLRNWLRAGNPIAGKSDGGGLTFTLSRAGTASWIFRYHHCGKPREATIGNYPDITLLDARVEATKLRAQVDRGIDVAAEKRKAKLEQRMASTFENLCERYLELAGVKHKETTRKEFSRYLSKDIYPRIGKLSIKEISAREVIYVVEQVAKRSQSVARRTFEILSVIFGFAVARHALPHNPCTGLKISAIIGEPRRRRERMKLSEDELRAILPSLQTIGRENALAIKILLATCTRKSELIKARWEHIDSDLWTIPAENSKNGKEFVIPLAPSVVRWFEELRSIAGDSPFVLPARKSGYGKRQGTIARDTLNEAINRGKLGGIHFSPHDLRSTARSHLAAMGINIVVSERCLNHELGGLISVYDKHDYLNERRSALELWASFLEECESGIKRDRTNLVAIDRRRRL